MINNNKDAAVNFLQLVVSGRIDEAYQKHVDFGGKHHNVYFAAGFAALQKAMKDNNNEVPDKKFMIKNAIGEGELVAVHSHLRLGEKEMSVVHIFRFQNDKIVEMWDCGQVIPADSPNKDGAF
ncbi:nuclear transport factor 2 family protein [Candidatus Micrarchaeota archaeon]|nr:nuclear transport factor 2 family protein [Candidatus Micrarchaeota archaeon]